MSNVGVEVNQSVGLVGEPVALDDVLKISVQKSVKSLEPMKTYSRTWNELVDWLREPKGVHASKDDAPLLKLATFGDRRGDGEGSFRHDANVLELSGVEADYDEEKVTPAEAAARLQKTGIRCLIYTSARHNVIVRGDNGKSSGGGPRWRVLAPFSRSRRPEERAHFVDILNGALNGILSPESWNLSLTYFYGRVKDVPYECIPVDGLYIDDLDDIGPFGFELIGKPASSKSAELEKRPMPALLQESVTPKWEPLGLTVRARKFLGGESGKDRSAELQHTATQLYESTCGDGALHDDLVLSILAYNATAMGVAMDHRGQRREKALLYLWGHCQDARIKVTPAGFDDHSGGDSGSPLDAYYAFLPMHQYIHRATRQLFPAPSVDGNMRGVQINSLKPTAWLDKHRAVHQMTWDPNRGELIEGEIVADGGWIESPGQRVYNTFRPALPMTGDAAQAGLWLEHLKLVFPEEWQHILRWLAHRVQRPGEKINHALVLGGNQGIGKDTLLEPVKEAVGRWNWNEITPQQMLGRFNGFAQSVVVRVNEARDLGEVDRFKFYDHSKQYIAAPPDVIRVDEKHRREFPVVNVMGVIITTNHRTDGIYLPADDRRHFVAWSPLSKEDFTEQYWTQLWGWFGDGGSRHVGAYLAAVNLTGFDAKAAPPKTNAFHTIVDAGQGEEEAGLGDVLEQMGQPPAVTMDQVLGIVDPLDELGAGGMQLRGSQGSRKFIHMMDRAGYSPVRNPDDQRGRWSIGKKRVSVFARNELPIGERLTAARRILNSPSTPSSHI